MQSYVYPEYAEISRVENAAVLFDSDGIRYFSFPADWTDLQIGIAISFANQAYRAGIESGKAETHQSIKKALGIQ